MTSVSPQPDGEIVHALLPTQDPREFLRHKYSDLDWDMGFAWECVCPRYLHVFRRPPSTSTTTPRAWRNTPHQLWQLTRECIAYARTADDFPMTVHYSGCYRAFKYQRLEHRIRHTSRASFSGCILA